MDRELIGRLIQDLEQLQQGLDRTASSSRDSVPPGSGLDVDQARWLASILAHSPDVISVLDLEGRLLYLSRAAGDRNPSDFVGSMASDFVPPSHREIWVNGLKLAIATGKAQKVEVFSAGNYYWETRIIPIEQDDQIKWLLTIGTDITAQRGAEAALAVKAQQLDLALEASGMGQWSWDIAEDRITWDAATKQIFGWPLEQDDIDLAAFLDRVHPGDRQRVGDAFRRSVETGEYSDLQYRIVLPDASVRWVLCKGRVTLGDDGKPTTILGGLMDATHSRRTEEQQQRAAKLEAIGQLAGGIAHDFNNLLVAILGNLELARQTETETERNERLSDAVDAVNRATELTRQLLVFSRRQPLNQVSVDCHEMLEDTFRLLRRLLPETIEVELIRAHRLPRVLGDRGQIEQVIMNLCLNARDAMPGGGQLVVETELVLVNGRFRDSHPWARPGRYVLISVTDTGSGIPQDQLERIFEPFFTTKAQGTGLGLATAYGIVKRHGGMLHVYSEVGKGTTLKVYLPIAERYASDVGSKVEFPVAGGNETILLAEDESAVRSVVTRILERAGYRVIAVEDGRKAVEAFRRQAAEIDLVMFDTVMPNQGGQEALAEIRAAGSKVPAILCSGYTEISNPWADTDKDVEFIPKPYEPDVLLRLLRRLLDQHTGSD